MIVGRDEDGVADEILYRLIAAAVAVRQLIRFRPAGEREQLVAQTHAEHRYHADEAAQRFDRLRQVGGVARPGRDHDGVGFAREQFFARHAVGYDGEPRAERREIANDRALHPAIDDDHVGPGRIRRDALDAARGNVGDEADCARLARVRRERRLHPLERAGPDRERGADRTVLAQHGR